MKKIHHTHLLQYTLAIAALKLAYMSAQAKETVELLPFGDFEHWTVRYITESEVIGGKTKALYMVGPTDTIYGNAPFVPSHDTPWGCSNAHAKAFGVDKVSVSVTPDLRDDGKGTCCRMETKLVKVKAGVLNMNALSTGSLYTGRLLDPVGMAQSSDPNSGLDLGIPFTKHPKALLLDYKAHIQPGEGIVFASAGSKVKHIPGHDEGQIIVILQHRWEENGHIYAYRVGTGIEHITHSTQGWINDHRVDVQYGDITERPDYKDWKGLVSKRYKARNKKGKMVCIEEMGWKADAEPTHIIIQISAGCQKPFTGRPGNIIWCDNIRLVY